jgi:mevalonate kinase
MNQLYTHGKLLISAEYLVLYGSKALAVPLRLGQTLQRIRKSDRKRFHWRAYYQDQLWFRATMDPATLRIIDSSDPQKASYLQQLIQCCIDLMPSYQEDLFRMDVETVLEFSPDWGFGSSSTLIALMAEWAEVNPLDLHFMVSDGSGYDVACAIADGPLVYRLRDNAPHYQHVSFSPSFKENLFFAWLGKKQPTASHLKKVVETLEPDYMTIHQFSRITEAMVQAEDLATFQDLMEEHEEALSRLLNLERVSLTRFEGIPGNVKSLGAWGGDFVMIATDTGEKALFDYLHKKDIHKIYSFGELVYDETELQQDTSD